MKKNPQIVIFESGQGSVQVRLEGETIWLNQAQMADVFGTSTDNVGLHLRNIYEEGELDEAATTEDFSVVRQEGARQVRRTIRHYNLDAVISVGYRVSSSRATRFRQWATRVLREHLTRGFSFVDLPARNGRLIRNGEPVLNDVGLAALALLVAESDAKNKDVMIRLIENLLASPATGGG